MNNFLYILVFFVFLSNFDICFASNFEKNEISRLRDVRDYQIRNCTSTECRERMEYLYKVDVDELVNNPRLYIEYGSLLDKEGKKDKVDTDVKRFCRRQYPHDRYMIDICIRNRTSN